MKQPKIRLPDRKIKFPDLVTTERIGDYTGEGPRISNWIAIGSDNSRSRGPELKLSKPGSDLVHRMCHDPRQKFSPGIKKIVVITGGERITYFWNWFKNSKLKNSKDRKLETQHLKKPGLIWKLKKTTVEQLFFKTVISKKQSNFQYLQERRPKKITVIFQNRYLEKTK